MSNRLQLLVGFFSLLLGSVLYLAGGRASFTYLGHKLSFFLHPLPWNFSNLLGPVYGFLPCFLHPFGFSLIGISLLTRNRTSRLALCCVFALMNVTFELGQKYRAFASQLIPTWFAGFSFLDSFKNFFMKGTFSVFDLVASILGAGAAFALCEIPKKGVET
ncbi:MAG: hypothetical protein AB1641_13655 [Thermodesulfobacteriota bacterium]